MRLSKKEKKDKIMAIFFFFDIMTNTMIATNPFTPQSGWEPKAFGGRNKELELFKAKLAQAENDKPDHIVILGEWGIGKTSLLRYFKKLAQGEGYLSALCPVGKFTDKDRTSDGINLLIEEIAKGLPIKDADEILEQKITRRQTSLQPQTLFTDKLIKIWKRLGTKLAVILLDDVQNFSAISQVIDIMRLVLSREEIVKNTKYLFVIASTPQGWQGFMDKHDPVGRFFRTRATLAKLTKSEASEIVRKTLQNTGVSFSQDIIENIFQYTDGHPYELQVLAHNLYEMQMEGKVNTSCWEKALDITLKDLGKDYFDMLYRQITDRELPVLEILCHNNNPLDIKEIKDAMWKRLKSYPGYPIRDTGSFIYRLVDKQILKKVSRGKYEIFDKMFREYFLSS